MQTDPIRVHLWLLALARAPITLDDVALAARLLDDRHPRWRE